MLFKMFLTVNTEQIVLIYGDRRRTTSKMSSVLKTNDESLLIDDVKTLDNRVKLLPHGKFSGSCSETLTFLITRQLRSESLTRRAAGRLSSMRKQSNFQSATKLLSAIIIDTRSLDSRAFDDDRSKGRHKRRDSCQSWGWEKGRNWTNLQIMFKNLLMCFEEVIGLLGGINVILT